MHSGDDRRKLHEDAKEATDAVFIEQMSLYERTSE